MALHLRPVGDEFLVQSIELAGLTADTATDDTDALELAGNAVYGLVLMALQMHRLDALEVTRRMCALFRSRSSRPLPTS